MLENGSNTVSCCGFQEIERLGGRVVKVASEATHLLCSHVARTVKFLTALSVVRHIINPDWVHASVREGFFLGKWPISHLDVTLTMVSG